MLLKKALIASICLALLPVVSFAQNCSVHSAEIFHGQVSITQDSAFELVVRLDRSSDSADELVADQAFVFRSEVPLPIGLEKLDGAARIIVRPDAVLIFADNQPALILQKGCRCSQCDDPETCKCCPNEGFAQSAVDLVSPSAAIDGYVLTGYQLSRFQSTSEDYLERALEGQPDRPSRTSRPHSASELRSSYGAFLAVDEGDCTSGGPGAETCKISGPSGSCNTTCNAGYDACCNEGSCTCEPV
jgi:hypothetical protein